MSYLRVVTFAVDGEWSGCSRLVLKHQQQQPGYQALSSSSRRQWQYLSAVPVSHHIEAIKARRHHSLLWPNAITFEWSQRSYLMLESATVHCDQRPQHLSGHKETIRARENHSLLWSNATTFEWSQRSYLMPEITTVHCLMSRE